MSARATATSPAAARGRTTKAAPKKAGRRKMRLTPRASILISAMAVVGVFAVAPGRAYLDQRAQLHALQRQADALVRQNVGLERRVVDLNDPATLERLARACLGMVNPGEIAFVPIPKDRAPTPPDCG